MPVRYGEQEGSRRQSDGEGAVIVHREKTGLKLGLWSRLGGEAGGDEASEHRQLFAQSPCGGLYDSNRHCGNRS